LVATSSLPAGILGGSITLGRAGLVPYLPNRGRSANESRPVPSRRQAIEERTMTRRLLAGTALALALVCLPFTWAQEKKPDVNVFIDPDNAGPDYAIQGEYLGETADKTKWGAEVVAQGNGTFLANFLPGGLRGEGGDYAKRIDATARTEGNQTTATSKDGKW